MLSIDLGLQLVQILIAMAVSFQAIENLALRSQLRNGPWGFDLVQKDFKEMKALFSTKMEWILALNLLAAGVLFFDLRAGPVLFLGTLWVSFRWRGMFNGGSDAMTLQILGALSVANFSEEPRVRTACLSYIAIQSIFSYFLAGIAKVRNPLWRKGSAFGMYLKAYTSFRRELAPPWQKLGAFAILSFELGFPLVFFIPETRLYFLGAAFLFHLVNVYALGLNRFFWVWIATYPAILFI